MFAVEHFLCIYFSLTVFWTHRIERLNVDNNTKSVMINRFKIGNDRKRAENARRSFRCDLFIIIAICTR